MDTLLFDTGQTTSRSTVPQGGDYWMLQWYMATITSNCDDYYATPGIGWLLLTCLIWPKPLTDELYFELAITSPCGCRISSPRGVIV